MDKAGTGQHIEGEIYEVDEKMLEKLDELEDHPRYYERRPEKVLKEDSNGKTDLNTDNCEHSLKYTEVQRLDFIT